MPLNLTILFFVLGGGPAEIDDNEMRIDFHNTPEKVDGLEAAKQKYYQNSAEYFSKVRFYQFKVNNGQLVRLT